MTSRGMSWRSRVSLPGVGNRIFVVSRGPRGGLPLPHSLSLTPSVLVEGSREADLEAQLSSSPWEKVLT